MCMTSWLLNLRPAIEALSFIEIRTCVCLQCSKNTVWWCMQAPPRFLEEARNCARYLDLKQSLKDPAFLNSVVLLAESGYRFEGWVPNKNGDTYLTVLEYVGTINHAAASYWGVNWKVRQPSRLGAPMLLISCSCCMPTTPSASEHIRIADKDKTCLPRYDNFNICVHKRNFQLLQQVILQFLLFNSIHKKWWFTWSCYPHSMIMSLAAFSFVGTILSYISLSLYFLLVTACW